MALQENQEDRTTLSFQPEAPFEATETDVEVVAEPLGGVLGVLVIKRGPNSGSRMTLEAGTTTAGRHPDSDIFLDDITVSRRHVELVWNGSGFDVVDVGSLNGTYVNRERIDRAPLSNGDELQIGKYKLVFIEGDGS